MYYIAFITSAVPIVIQKGRAYTAFIEHVDGFDSDQQAPKFNLVCHPPDELRQLFMRRAEPPLRPPLYAQVSVRLNESRIQMISSSFCYAIALRECYCKLLRNCELQW
ncbi:hypothetical protein R1sor_018324 [Riccia sorocarpa]|uniref:Uncharacterized protein n=1 Tax=Riccia sorocarpa TaxID=122646 RepID=A0ABD3IDF9_9MARC